MDKELGKEFESPVKRLEFLKSNCFGIEEKGYMKQFGADTMTEMKDELADVSIEANEIEINKKVAMDDFKEQLKPLNGRISTLLDNIKKKAEYVTEDTFKMVYESERMIGYFNANGDLIEARPMRPEEMQRNMFIPVAETKEAV